MARSNHLKLSLESSADMGRSLCAEPWMKNKLHIAGDLFICSSASKGESNRDRGGAYKTRYCRRGKLQIEFL